MENLQMTSSSFGELLKAYRKRKRLTQQQLACQLSVHKNTVSSWELGTYLPATRGLILELARHLGLDEMETRQLLEASLTALSPYWYVPFPRNPFFTGREEILHVLHTTLNIDQMAALMQSYALHGLGGVGKTQIALEYAYRHALEYSAVFWIGAETFENTVTSLLRIAEVLQLPEREDKDQHRVLAAVQRWLSMHSRWLLIWDNVEDLDLVDRFLPPARQGAILITTRCQTLGTLAGSIDLPPMGQEEGMLFLLRRAKVLDQAATLEQARQFAVQRPLQYEAALELVTAMGGLPLALDQAGAYLEATRCGLPAYLKLFHTRRAALLQQRGERSRDHPASVSTTFMLAVTATARRHPAVCDLLQVCALLQPDAIPEEFFREGAKHLGAQLQTVCGDSLSWNRVVAAACSYSLLQRHPAEQTLSMHRLVQAVLLDEMTDDERTAWSSRAIAVLDLLFPEVTHTTEYTAWKQCEQLLPHTLLCLHRAGPAGRSRALASLACKVAQYLHVRGRYAEAESFSHQALSIWEHVLGPDHLEVASPLTSLAILYWEQGKYAQAEPLFRRALRIWERFPEPDPSEMARALNGLANLYWSRGEYAEAEPLFQRALQVREQALGPDHPDVVSPLSNLASIYAEQGKRAQAEPLFRRALVLAERTRGADHPLVAFCLNNLAELYREQGKYAQAEPLHQRALHIRESTLGANHPLVAFSLNNLAELYAEQGKYARAEPLHRRALHIWEQVLGADHPECARALHGLASLECAKGNYTQAQALFQRACAIRERALGSDHALLAQSLNGLASLFREQGKEREAEEHYQRAISIREQRLGERHPETAETLHDLALFRQRQGRLGEARFLAERASQIRFHALGYTHPKTLASRALASQLVRQFQDSEKGQRSQTHVGETSGERRTESLSEMVPISSYLSTEAAVSEKDLFQEFLRACCEQHPRAWCRSADLWRAYERWGEANHERFPLSRRAFINQLKMHGCRADRTRTARIWRGIRIVTAGDAR